MSHPAHSPHPDPPSQPVGCAILTASDTRSPETDRSGQLIQELLTGAGHPIIAYQVLKDEPTLIRGCLTEWADQAEIDVILCNGGTGIAPRDTTYEAIEALLEKELSGFGELFRMLSYPEIGSRAMASRAVAGVYRGKLVFSMPGSSNAVRLAMEKLILPELIHLSRQLKGSSL
ncbi:MAG: MogA/MoaB family molybdenum cofactor biosynthesis protein [Leptolyngbyaceae cyanobacterium bins.59]|nr:MogA/MoaB family molybdenum cofactor biosynthesis protein [Leptolyngbyaceae cyanobacterium bins.59]